MILATVALAPAYDPGSWSTFFVLVGTVAATLTGLFSSPSRCACGICSSAW